MTMARKITSNLLPLILFLLAVFVGCETTDERGSSVSGHAAYEADLSDPWYYGAYYNDPDIIVIPPPRPEPPPQPTHPIVIPPGPRPTPMPSIPRAPAPRAR